MSEKIGRNFEQAESVKPITKAEKEYTDEEIAEIEEERAKTNSELLGSGAYSEVNEETGEEKLFASQEQIRKIHEDTKEIPAQGSSKKPGIEDIKFPKAKQEPHEDVIVEHKWKSFKALPKSYYERKALREGEGEQKKINHAVQSEKDAVKNFLRKEVESLRQEKTDLEKRVSTLETEIADMWNRHLNLHEQDVLGKKEDEYQMLTPQLNQKKQEEEEIQKKLVDLEYGMMSAEIKDKIIKAIRENSDILSKKKQKIEEEKNRILNNMTGNRVINDRELKEQLSKIAAESAHKGGQQGRLTTGRHATHISGNIDSANAAEEFYHKTTDTHGGKVGYGKRQRKDAGGRTIRKR